MVVSTFTEPCSAVLGQHCAGYDKNHSVQRTTSQARERKSSRVLSEQWQKTCPHLFLLIFKAVTEGRECILILEILSFFLSLILCWVAQDKISRKPILSGGTVNTNIRKIPSLPCGSSSLVDKSYMEMDDY